MSGPEGTDTLTGIERVKFSDGTLAFDPSIPPTPRRRPIACTGRLDQDVTRENVLAGFSESPENIAHTTPLINDSIWFA